LASTSHAIEGKEERVLGDERRIRCSSLEMPPWRERKEREDKGKKKGRMMKMTRGSPMSK